VHTTSNASGLRLALRERNYRWFSGGMVSFTLSQSMIRFLLPWLAYDITGSTLALGLVGFALAGPNVLLAPFGGMWADRLERAALVRFTQTTVTLLIGSFAILVFAGTLQLPYLVLFAFAIGGVTAFDQPARQALIPALVPMAALTTALALNQMTWSLAGIVGPATAGALLAITIPLGLGPGPIFMLTVAGSAAMVFATLHIRIPRARERTARRHWSVEFLEGARFIVADPAARGLTFISFSGSILGSSYLFLMPAFAHEIYGVDTAGLGLLVASSGVGALLGSVVLALFGGRMRRGRVALASSFGFGIAVVAFSLSRSLPIGLAILLVAGAINAISFTTAQTLLQVSVPDRIRGRVMGIYALTFSLSTLGAAISGTLAAFIGPSAAVLIGGALVLVAAASVALLSPTIRELA
jgi:MFS family permease